MVASDSENDRAYIAGDGGYAIEVATDSADQARLEWLVQGRGEEPVDYVCTALLLSEPDNAADPNTVSVCIHGVQVGHLPAEAAASMVAAMDTWGFEEATCEAYIEGGWYRSAEDKGDFCVWLDVNPDFAPSAAPIRIDAPAIVAPAAAPVAAAVAAAAPRTSGFDLAGVALGAVTTFAVLALAVVAWLVLQPPARPGGGDQVAGAMSAQALVAAESSRLDGAALQVQPARDDPQGSLDLAAASAVPSTSGLNAAAPAADAARPGLKPAIRRRPAVIEEPPSTAAATPLASVTLVAAEPDAPLAVEAAAVREAAAQPVVDAAAVHAPPLTGGPLKVMPPPRPETHAVTARAKARSDLRRARVKARLRARAQARRRNAARYNYRKRNAAQMAQTAQAGNADSPRVQLPPAARMFDAWTREWNGVLRGPQPAR